MAGPPRRQAQHAEGGEHRVPGLASPSSIHWPTHQVSRGHIPLCRSFPQPEGEGYHIALLHGSLDWDRGDRSLPIDGQALEKAGYDYVALGHIHKHIVRGERRPIVYPGMIDGKDFDDPGVGMYTVATLVSSGASIETVPVEDITPIITLQADAGLYESAAQLIAAVGKELPRRAAVRLVLAGTPGFTIDRERIFEALAETTYYLEVVDESAGLADELIEQLSVEPTVRGAFVGAYALALLPPRRTMKRR